MKTVWRNLVSVVIMAAIGAGCGGGSGGGDGATGGANQLGATPAQVGTTLQKQKLLTIKYGEFNDPHLLVNKQGDVLLVWDAQVAGGGIRAMFYQPDKGWGSMQQVMPQRLDAAVAGIEDVFLDDQGNAVVLVAAVLSSRIYVFNAATGIWKKVEWPVVANGKATSGLVADNSSKSVAMLAYFVGLAKDSTANYYTDLGIRVYKLYEDGTWEEGATTSVLVNGDEPMPLCFVSRSGICIYDPIASADDTGRMHVSYDVENNGKRVSTWSEAAGWSEPHILDRDHVTGLLHESFLSVNRNGKGVAIWQSWKHRRNEQGSFGPIFSDGRKTAWFDGASWLPTEIGPDTMSKMKIVHVSADGATEAFGETENAASIGASAGMRRPSPSASWTSPELFPIDVRRYPLKYLERHGAGWIVPFKQYYEVEPSQASNPIFPYRVRIDEIRYGAAGWTGIQTFTDQDWGMLGELMFAAVNDKLLVIELKNSSLLGGDEYEVNTFSFTIP